MVETLFWFGFPCEEINNRKRGKITLVTVFQKLKNTIIRKLLDDVACASAYTYI